MSIALCNAPSAIFREEQWFSRWVYITLVIMFSLGWAMLGWSFQFGTGRPDLLGATLAFSLGLAYLAIPTFLVTGLLKLTTVVLPGEIRVWYGVLPTYRRVLAVCDVLHVEVVRFRPLLDHGGWGIRRGRAGERVFTARGNQGVRLTLRDGSVWILGSQVPEELAESVRRGLNPGA